MYSISNKGSKMQTRRRQLTGRQVRINVPNCKKFCRKNSKHLEPSPGNQFQAPYLLYPMFEQLITKFAIYFSIKLQSMLILYSRSQAILTAPVYKERIAHWLFSTRILLGKIIQISTNFLISPVLMSKTCQVPKK